jgi:hypothetical protein
VVQLLGKAHRSVGTFADFPTQATTRRSISECVRLWVDDSARKAHRSAGACAELPTQSLQAQVDQWTRSTPGGRFSVESYQSAGTCAELPTQSLRAQVDQRTRSTPGWTIQRKQPTGLLAHNADLPTWSRHGAVRRSVRLRVDDSARKTISLVGCLR